jgi:Ni,Fe-hydrogenase I cytochrome b subunit
MQYPGQTGMRADKRLAMAEHKHGSMDVRAQEKTFEGFIRLATWAAGIAIAVLIFLAIFNA